MKHAKAFVAFVMAGSLSVASPMANLVFADSVSSPVTSTVSSGKIQAKLTQEQAVAVVKAAGLPVPDEAPNSASLHYDYGPYGPNLSSNPIWDLNWNLGNPGIDPNFGNLNAAVDAVTGTLLRFNVWKQADTTTFPPKVDKTQAKNIAFALIKKLQPEKSQSVKLIEMPTVTGQGSLRGQFQYLFQFERMVHGIAVPSDGFHVSVDGNGNVVAYDFSWSNLTDAQFPDASHVIDIQQANQTYSTNLNLQLAYQPFFGPYKSGGPEMHLIYRPAIPGNSNVNLGIPYYVDNSYNGIWIDATSGALLDMTGKPINPEGNQSAFPQVLDPNGQDTPATPLAQPLTVDQAREIAKKYVQVDDSFTLNQNISNYNKHTFYDFQWNKNDPVTGTGKWAGATIDAQTGQLVNFHQNLDNSNSSSSSHTITQEEAQKIAIDFVKQVMPNKTKALFLRPQPKGIGGQQGKVITYSFNFGMLINGVPSDMDSVNVDVNAVTGKVESFYGMSPINSDNGKYPDPRQAISPEKAKTLYQDVNPLQLQYVRPAKSDLTGPSDTFLLVYAPSSTKPGEVLDAITGDWLSPYGSTVADPSKQATDIKGHWAENSLEIMIDKGILQVVNGKVNPDSAITKGDLLRMLILSIGVPVQAYSNKTPSFQDVSASSEYFPYVETAVTYHWIDKGDQFHPEANVTREELAELLTRALGYADLAKYPSLFNIPFQDTNQIDKDLQGDVAIVNGLGIMHGYQNSFMPKKHVTVAEAAVSIIKTVEVINNKTDRGPIYYLKDLKQKVQKQRN
jgi:hypothetical protein